MRESGEGKVVPAHLDVLLLTSCQTAQSNMGLSVCTFKTGLCTAYDADFGSNFFAFSAPQDLPGYNRYPEQDTSCRAAVD